MPLIPDRTIFVTSLSKSLFPGMRLGCVVAPPAVLEKICRRDLGDDDHAVADRRGSAVRLDRGRHRRAHRRVEAARDAARQAMARRLLEGERLQTHPASPHMWLQLPARWSSDGFVAAARARGVIVNASSEFAVGDQHPRAVRLCLGTPRTRAGLEQALTRIVSTLADRRLPARAVV